MSVSVTVRVDVQLSPGVWTAITADVVGESGIRLRYGVDGSGPTDCLADTGQCQFALRNDAGNSVATLGLYSPAHASKRVGWTYGIPVRVVFTYSAVDYTKFRGKLRSILPDAGAYRARRVHVTADDGMGDLHEADVRNVALQTDKTDAELLTAILDSIPTDAQPVARSLDAGVDVYPYALDDVKDGQKAAALIENVVLSAYGMAFVKGDGTFRYLSRNTRATVTSSYAFTTGSMHELSVPSTLDKVYNHVRATIHPKTIDAAATTVLWAQTGSAPEIAPGASQTIWGTYRDPNNIQTLIGGLNAQPVVATTDYAANIAADGSGADMTASVSVTATAFATTAKFVVTNNSAVQVYLTSLQIRGKGVYDNGPRTFETSSVQTYGDRPVDIDMPYQDDPEIGQSAAIYIEGQYRNPSQQIESIEFIANQSDAFMTQALTREPGDRITVSEVVTGLTAVDAIIQSVELEVRPGLIVVCRWGLAPVSPLTVWQLGMTGFGELGVTPGTTLGF